MSTLFTQDYSRVMAMGVGSLGCITARVGDEEGDGSAAVWSAAHVDSAELIATGLERKLFLKMSEGPFAARSLKQSIDANSGTLERCARGRDAAILCGELNDPLTIRLIEALSDALSDLNIAVFALVIEPFSPNGAGNLNGLERELSRLSETVPCVCALNPGMENVSAGIAVKRIRKMAAERLAAAAECLAGALGSGSAHAPQLLELRGLQRAVYSTAAQVVRTATGAQTSAAVNAYDLARRSFDEDAAERIQAAIVSSASEMSFRETQAITRLLPDGAELIATTNPSRFGLAECLLLSGNERAGNVVSIGAGMESGHAFAVASRE